MITAADYIDRLHRNFPNEMKFFRNFILWKTEPAETLGGKPRKVPVSAHTGFTCDVTDIASHASFDHCCSTYLGAKGYYSGLGWCFTRNDPYCGIDLDHTNDQALYADQVDIYQRMQSYSERSPSGNGLHIIVKASVPQGRKRYSVEVYSEDRFFTITGDSYDSNYLVADRQYLVEQLWMKLTNQSKINRAHASQVDAPVVYEDTEVIDRAASAYNGDRFTALFHYGDWSNTIDAMTGDMYRSQSEADLALMNMIAFYTQNQEQMRRLFMLSALGKRDKARRNDYMLSIMTLALDQVPPDVDFATLKQVAAAELAAIDAENEAKKAVPKSTSFAVNIDPHAFPPGLVGGLAQLFYDRAPIQIKQTALAGALGLMAAVCGQAYNVSNNGLNLYLLLLAQTGIGKDSMQNNIAWLFHQLEANYPQLASGVLQKFIGPGRTFSGQALQKQLSEHPSFLTIMGEFGYRLKEMSDERAPLSLIGFRGFLLDCYSKSGSRLEATAYTDKDKSIGAIVRPALSILGESTPSTFYRNITERVIIDGLLPRFDIIEYDGPKPYLNAAHSQGQLDPRVAQHFVALVETVQRLMQPGLSSQMHVQMTEDVREFFYKLDRELTDKQNAPNAAALTPEILSRVHMKTMKIAALIAVGVNHTNPYITLDIAQWAYRFELYQVNRLLDRIAQGQVDTQKHMTAVEMEDEQYRALAYAIYRFIDRRRQDEARKCYGYTDGTWNNYVVSVAYLHQRISNIGCFKNDRTAKKAKLLDNAIATLIEMETITRVNLSQPGVREALGIREDSRAKYIAVPHPQRLLEVARLHSTKVDEY